MTNINLRLYGDQIYSNLSKYLSEYITPEIEKEQFLKNYQEGIMEMKEIKLKEKIYLHHQIVVDDSSIGELTLKIPDEKENFSIYLNDVKCSLLLSDIKDEEIEALLIDNKKKLIDDFISYSKAKIEQKDNSSFFDNLIKSFIDKILNGLTIDINNLELKIKIDNRKNTCFIFMIESINYSIDKGIKIKNSTLIYEENNKKINVIEKFDFNVDITYSNDEAKPNKIYLSISDFKFQINKNIYFEFLSYFNLFNDADYKKIYIKYKKLIQYNRPELINGKKNYQLLWKYAIKTVNRLHKYISDNNQDIFDLKKNEQIKIIKKYLDEEKPFEGLLLIDDLIALKSTKEKAENKVLENKKGGVLKNAFSFFFGAQNEEKEELTEEEKEISNEIYKEENIIKYLSGNSNDNKKANLNTVIDKVIKFLSNVSIDVNIAKLELIIQNINIGNKQNLFVKGMKMNMNYINKEFDFSFSINDIGYEQDKSFFGEKDKLDLSDAIDFKRDKNNLISLSFGFKNIELNEELFMCLITFFNSIKTKKRYKLFHEKKYILIDEQKEKEAQEKKNEIMKNIKNFSFMNDFKLSNIPSFSIISKDNKVEVNIKNYALTENSLNFTVNIKDSFGVILNDFTCSPKIENNKFVFHLDSPMNIILSSESTKCFFLNYLRYQKELSNKNDDKNSKEKGGEAELFKFNFTSYQNIDLGDIDMNNYSADIMIKKINIQIFEEKEKYQSSFVIDQFKFLYEKKNLDISLNKFIITSNLMSTMILYFLDFESPLLSKYKEIISFKNGDINELLSNFNINQDKDDNDNDICEIKNDFNYSKLLKDILNNFNFKLNIFSFVFQANNLVMSLNFNNINAFKEERDINSSFDNWYFDIQSPKFNFKSKKIIENNQKTNIKYELDSDIIKGNMKSVYFNTNLEEVVEMWENTSFLMNQINWDIILCKMDLKVEDFALVFDQFKYSISNILFVNFKEGQIKNDTFYFKILEFRMTNQENVKIIYEKELDIDYVFTSSNENNAYIKCNNVDIKISQHDISFLLLCIKLPEKSDEENLKKYNSINVTNVQVNKNQIDLLGFEEIRNENKDNKIKSQESFINKPKDTRLKFLINVNINIPKLNLCFCLNEKYSKVAEFSIESFTIKFKSAINENILDKTISSDLSHTLLLGKVNFNYFYSQNNKTNIINVLTKRKINDNENENIIIEKDETENQIEFINDSNGYKINMNHNEVTLRIDSLLSIYYYFKGAIPIDKMIDNLEQADLKINDNNNKKKNNQINLNCFNSKFKLNTSFYGNENLSLDINKFIFLYNFNIEKELPYGTYMIVLSQLSANISSKNNIREIFQTSDNFLNIKIDFSKEILSLNILMDIITINLSYRDLLSFLRVYSLNMKTYKIGLEKREEYLKNLKLNEKIQIESKKKIKNEKKDNNIQKIDTPGNLNKKINKIVISGDYNLEKINVTLIDNSKGSFHPFMSININKVYGIINPDQSIDSSFSFQLYSYNYISCVWEPTIEKTIIKYNIIFKNENLGKNNRIKIDVNEIYFNLSDMAISFTLCALNNWSKKLKEKQKKFEEKATNIDKILSKNEKPKNIKVTNNQVINYTGKQMKIIYNEMEIDCPPLKVIELEYINENNKLKNNPKYITLIYDKDHKFEIPLEKIVTLRHIVNNDLSIISENSLSENRTINISIYSPLILKNKSIYALQLKVENQNIGNTFIVLNPNSTTGIPLNFINEKTKFNFMLINTKLTNEQQKDENKKEDYSEQYSLDYILNIKTDFTYKKKIKFEEKMLLMVLDHSIRNVRTLIICTEISIVNCLPCDIKVHFSKKLVTIKKCSQYFVDNNENFCLFSINTSNSGEFCTESFNILNLKSENNYLEFKNKKQRFRLLCYLKKNKERNTLIIYSESFLYNNSGIVLQILSSNKESKENKVCFGISKSISLVSSNIDYKEVYIQFVNSYYISKKINFSELIEVTPYLKVDMKNEKGHFFSFYIKKNFSYMTIINNPNFKENIMSMIFTILPCCRIINLLSTQRFFICNYHNMKENTTIAPLEKVNFHFYGNGENDILYLSVMNLNNKLGNLIKFRFNIGIYTLSTEDYTFNLEIRKNPSEGCIEVFVIENSIDNSKILLENLTNEEIGICQINYEKFKQILQPKDIQALKLYNYESPDFMIEIGNQFFTIKFNDMKEDEKRIKIKNKIIVSIISNDIKMKVTFYLIEDFNKLTSSSINNYYSLNVNSIIISLIGDNESKNKKLTNYKRNELLLLVFYNFSLTINQETSAGVLNKDSIQFNLILSDFSMHNQSSTKGKFSCILRNKTPFISLYEEINYFKNIKIITTDNLNVKVGQLELGIDPEFFIELLDFFSNILYRMNITNFNVHEIFETKKKNNDEMMTLLNDEYKESRILLNSKDLYFPELNIKFEVTNIGLKDLLKNRIGCTEFYIWLAKGLVGRRHSLNLPYSKHPFKYGGIGQFFKNIYIIFERKIENEVTQMGLKGLVGKFKNLFTYDPTAENNVEIHRFREPRVFYGKFKYFQIYNKQDAYLVSNVYKKYTYLKDKYYPLRIIKSSKIFFLFTTLSMVCFQYTKFVIKWNIDYFMIKKAESDKEEITIFYNQTIENSNSYKFNCESIEVAQEVAQALNEETKNNRENFLEI